MTKVDVYYYVSAGTHSRPIRLRATAECIKRLGAQPILETMASVDDSELDGDGMEKEPADGPDHSSIKGFPIREHP